MKFSLIIPTLNEENYLPLLLESIAGQNFYDYEIIVADANSSDRTEFIAKKFGAKIVSGGMPAKGRNAGARIAQGEYLLFLDADTTLPKHFLKNMYTEMHENALELATCKVVPLSNRLIDKALHTFTNAYIRMSLVFNPHAPGFCIACSRRLFTKTTGFDETLTIAEDHEFVKRATKISPLRLLRSTVIQVSVRRLDKEGRMGILQKYVVVEFYRFFKGEMRTEVIKYEFGNF